LERFRGERNLFVSGFGRSGDSWIAYLLAYCLNSPYYDVDGDGTGFSLEREELQQHLSGSNDHQHSQRFDRVLKTHASPDILPLGANDRVIYVVRDARDVVTSFFYFVEKQWAMSDAASRRLLIRALRRTLPDQIRFDLMASILGYEWSREASQALAQGWQILRYEDTMRDPMEALRTALEIIDPGCWDPEVARRAIDIFSFDNMQAAAIRSAPDSHSTRSGRVGDWRSHFDSALGRRFLKQHGVTLRRLGYATEPVGTAQQGSPD
jgi:hypothetical protein